LLALSVEERGHSNVYAMNLWCSTELIHIIGCLVQSTGVKNLKHFGNCYDILIILETH